MKGFVKEKEFLAIKEKLKENTNRFLRESTGNTHDRQLQILMFVEMFPEAKREFLSIDEVPPGFHPGKWEDGRNKGLDVTRVRFI